MPWRNYQKFRLFSLLGAFLSTSLHVTLASNTSAMNQSRDWTVCLRDGYGSWSLVTRPEHEICPLASDWSAWTYQPFCLKPDTEDDESEPVDCVYTATYFRGNQGISLITTPDLAASIVPHLDDSRVPPALRYQLADPGHGQEQTAGYEIKDFPGRGKGMLAKRKFAEHETIMVGYPVLIVRLDFLNGDRLTDEEKQVMMETSVKRLPRRQRREFMTLARSTGGFPILDIIRTNGFGIEIDGFQHLAVFLDGSVSFPLPT